MAVTYEASSQTALDIRLRLAYAALALDIGALLGVAVVSGLSLKFLIAGAIAPFVVALVLARPHLAATVYVVLVYTDLLSLLVQYQGMPPLARFVCLVMLCLVMGSRLIL